MAEPDLTPDERDALLAALRYYRAREVPSAALDRAQAKLGLATCVLCATRVQIAPVMEASS